MTSRILVGDCRELMAALDPESVDACVTDPPYGIGFMGREWDTFKPETVAALSERRRRKADADPSSERYPGRRGRVSRGGAQVDYDETASGNRRFQAWTEEWARELFRVLKPGAHLVCFGGTRTYHRVASGIEDAGFELRDSLMWIFGSGFPKSKNLDGERAGWGTALKPAYEPIVLARKPIRGTVAATVERYGTGALNIDGCRIGTTKGVPASGTSATMNVYSGGFGPRGGEQSGFNPNVGRWPANVVLDEEAAALLDAMSGVTGERARVLNRNGDRQMDGWGLAAESKGIVHGDTGGASRFFYTAKASRAERNRGLDGVEETTVDDGRQTTIDNPYLRGVPPRRNVHPTVKPVALMQWLVRLVAPPGGLVLDPFCGSGTTGIACDREGVAFLGMELSEEYAEIARRRIRGDAPLFADVERLAV